MSTASKIKPNQKDHHDSRVQKEITTAPWVLRITEHKDKPVPVMIVKERIHPDQRTDADQLTAPRSILKESGLLYGPQLTRCLPVVRAIVDRVRNRQDIPLELGRYVSGQRVMFRGNLPLNAEAGCKLALIFKLQERIKELDRVELLARRVERFTREEASYWYSRISTFGDAANRWAAAGMKLMLAGQPKDPNIETMLNDLRGTH